MNRQEAKLHIYELWQNGEIPSNFDENHSDYDKAIKFTLENGSFNYEEFCNENAIIKFGIWQVESDALIGKVRPGHDYVINDSRFWENSDYRGHLVWDWLIHLAEKTWINKENVKDLNNAFFFCQDFFKSKKPSNIPYISTAQTLYIQRQILEIDEEIEKVKKKTTSKIFQPDFEDMKRYNELTNSIKFL